MRVQIHFDTSYRTPGRGPKPSCLCGTCKLCRHRASNRARENSRRRREHDLAKRPPISDEELERRILAYWEKIKTE